LNAKAKITLTISLVIVISLFLLFSSMLITGALSAGMMKRDWIVGIIWLWIPVALTLWLSFVIGRAVFSRNPEKKYELFSSKSTNGLK